MKRPCWLIAALPDPGPSPLCALLVFPSSQQRVRAAVGRSFCASAWFIFFFFPPWRRSPRYRTQNAAEAYSDGRIHKDRWSMRSMSHAISLLVAPGANPILGPTGRRRLGVGAGLCWLPLVVIDPGSAGDDTFD